MERRLEMLELDLINATGMEIVLGNEINGTIMSKEKWPWKRRSFVLPSLIVWNKCNEGSDCDNDEEHKRNTQNKAQIPTGANHRERST